MRTIREWQKKHECARSPFPPLSMVSNLHASCCSPNIHSTTPGTWSVPFSGADDADCAGGCLAADVDGLGLLLCERCLSAAPIGRNLTLRTQNLLIASFS